MKTIALVACLFLAGCGSHYVIPASSTQPQKIISSGYTASGCYSNLAEQARVDNSELRNMVMDSSGMVAGIVLFPFVKGYSCTADAIPRK